MKKSIYGSLAILALTGSLFLTGCWSGGKQQSAAPKTTTQSAPAKDIYNSSRIPGEIQDLCVVNSRVEKASPEFARALNGAWYEVAEVMSEATPATDAAIAKMAELAKCSPEDYRAQLRTTAMFYTPQAAVEYMSSADLKAAQDRVRNFCFTHDLLGENAASVDVVGIQYPDGSVQGDANNVTMRYVSKYTQEVADGTISLSGNGAAPGAPKKKFTLAVSIYAGWMPWYYANESGILKKWADHYGIEIEVQYMDYVPSIEAYVAGQADACVMTNMECLDMPAAAGVDSSIVIMGDYSNGNDAILARDGITIGELKGQNIYLVEKTVSHYMLVRALEEVGLSESDVNIVNVSDADIAPSFLASQSQKVVVTWNPMVLEILNSGK